MCSEDVVLIKDSLPRNQWPLGIITRTLPSEDGLVRKVFIRVKTTDSGVPLDRERAIHDLVLLLPKEEHDVHS